MRTRYLSLIFSVGALFCQDPVDPKDRTPPARMPNGSLQSEEILKAEHASSLKDSQRLKQLSEELSADLEKNNRHVVSMQTLKKLDEMEKLVKRIRARMKRI